MAIILYIALTKDIGIISGSNTFGKQEDLQFVRCLKITGSLLNSIRAMQITVSYTNGVG